MEKNIFRSNFLDELYMQYFLFLERKMKKKENEQKIFSCQKHQLEEQNNRKMKRKCVKNKK